LTQTSQLIKGARLEKGISQIELADKIGVSASFIRKVERGGAPWPKARIAQLSKALGVKKIEIFNAIVCDFEGRLK